MPSDLWWKVMKLARSKKTNCAEIIRQITEKEMNDLYKQ